jgi:hypothetical protein
MLTCIIPNETRPCSLWDLQHVHCEGITPVGKAALHDAKQDNLSDIQAPG